MVLRTLAVLALIGLLIAVGWYWSAQVAVVDIGTVNRGGIVKSIIVEGAAQASQPTIVSANTAGLLQRVELKVGDSVQAGMTLAIIDPAPAPLLDARSRKMAEAKLNAAQAEWKRADAARELALSNLKQVQKKKSSISSPSNIARPLTPDLDLEEQSRKLELEAAERAQDRARFDWDGARAQLGLAPDSAVSKSKAADTEEKPKVEGSSATELGLVADQSKLLATFEGQVLRVFQREPTLVSPGTPLLEMGDLKHMQFAFDVLTKEATAMRVGMPVDIRRWGDQEQSLSGKIRFIEPAAQSTLSPLGVDEVRTRVWVELSAETELPVGLGHGFRVEGVFQVAELKDVLKVPLGAIYRQDGRWYVFRFKEGRAIQTEVELGLRNDREASVLSGLNEHDPVILYPANRIQNGMPVMIR